MTEESRKGAKGCATMKPPLGTQDDQDALWEGIHDRTIDLIETDHAPHAKEEKKKDPPAYGVPGLETATGLMFRAVHEGKIKKEDIPRLLHDNAKRIFNIPDQENTYIELDPDRSYTCGEDGYETKCGWSPFDKMELYGKIENVVFKGNTLMTNGKLM